MNSLSSKQQSFVKLMKDGEDQERHGFQLLSKRTDLGIFFDALVDEGLFDPSRNPGPVASDTPGYYRIPYWPPLLYLEAAAGLAAGQADAVLADKIMGVIRNVSLWRDSSGKPCDNHTTWYSFAKIFGSLPASAVSLADIDLVPTWLTGRFDRSMAGRVLASGVLRRFLASEHPGDWTKACRILYHCTAVEFVNERPEVENATTKPRTILDDHSLKELINATAVDFGRRIGNDASDVFLERLSTVFAHRMNRLDSSVFRPAIENHAQNYDWNGPYNRFVEGLRDTVLAWLDSKASMASPYVESMLGSGIEIVERVAIHLVDQRFETLRALVEQVIAPTFFDDGHRHELHIFLKNHFQQFTKNEMAATLDAIRQLPLPDKTEHPERRRRIIQQRWMSAIAGQGYEPAETWLADLNSAGDAMPLIQHPEFNSYHETRWGSGPTPYKVEEIVAFAEQGIVVDQLNAFAPSDIWDGPSIRSLSDAVIDAVGAAPEVFVERLPEFLNAKAEYQYAVIAGFKKLWDAWDGKQRGFAWDDTWPKLIEFFERVLNADDLWNGEIVDQPMLSPTRDWIPPVISEFLRAGTRSDDKAYPTDLLSRTLQLVVTLLDKAESEKKVAGDGALNRAINTAKGKAVEALVDHALRRCRLADQASRSHAEAWNELQQLFDGELAQCRDGNFEFSALAGAYIGNLHYMSAAWVDTNFGKIFPVEFPANCLSALDGLAFAPATDSTYVALVTSGVLDWALGQEINGQHARENLLQRIGLAYLRNKEELNGPRFAYLFGARRADDLEELCQYFWMVRGEPLSDDQKERIFLFWDRCITWSASLDSPPTKLLSLLSLLSTYLTAIDKRALGWLLAVAPYASVNYNADALIEELVRLAAVSPGETGQILLALLKGYQPVYDFEDRLKQLITQLATHAESRSDAIRCIELVRHLSGMVQLYAQLS